VALVAAAVLLGGTPVDVADAADTAQPVAVAQAVDAQERVTDEWLDRPGVLGTAVGVEGGGAAVVAFVEDDDVDLPARTGGVPVEVVVTAPFRAQSCPTTPPGFCDRPVPTGVSVSHPEVTAGTLGALVVDGGGQRYVLSSNHVLADENQGGIGDHMIQPGTVDGGSAGVPAHRLGQLSDFEPIVYCGNPCTNSNVIDAAIAEVGTNVLPQNWCGWAPTSQPVPPAALVPGQTVVKKCGRTTGSTSGVVSFVNATLLVQYGGGVARFVDQIVTTDMSNGGDSGSLMVDTLNRPVALLTGGSGDGSNGYTFGNPIGSVLSRFGVSLVGSPPPPAPGCAPAANGWGSAVVGGFSTPTGNGYRLVHVNGTVDQKGDAVFLGDASCFALNAPVLGGASTPAGAGYWLQAADGGVFSYGSAAFHGSLGATPLNAPVFAMSSAASGQGYWLIAFDGGLFTFGDAGFFGSTGGILLNQPIVGMTASPNGQGYRMVGRDGGIFSFGDVPFLGSLPGIGVRVNDVVAMLPTQTGMGYWVVREFGQTYTFGDASYFGNPFLFGDRVVGGFANPAAPGYRLVLASGATAAFGNAPG
jgi:hypothetical protein